MKTERAILQKRLCIALLVMVLAKLPGPLQAQFMEVDIELSARFEMRMICPEELLAGHADLPERATTLMDGTLLTETLLWLEVSSAENLELLMDTGGEHPVYYINTGVFDPQQAVPFTESTAFRLSKSSRPDATTRLFKAWIGIRPGEKKPININYN